MEGQRSVRILKEAQDPQVAILLLDFILGYNASMDPVGDLIESISKAREITRRRGGELSVVASICGTDEDPQDLGMQKKMLEENGVIVFQSNARATEYCIPRSCGSSSVPQIDATTESSPPRRLVISRALEIDSIRSPTGSIDALYPRMKSSSRIATFGSWAS